MIQTIKIIGTSHIAKESLFKIEKEINLFNPEIIAVELDRKRFYSMMHKLESKLSIKDIRRVGFSGFLFLIIGRFVQKKLGSIVGVDPGADMKKAIDICKEKNLQLALIDRDIDITLHRFSKSFSFKEKMLIIRDIIFSPFSRQKVNIDISKVPDKEFIKTILLELKKRYPSMYSVLVHERNEFMAKKLFKLYTLNPNKKILAVVGAGHEEGLFEELKKLYQSNISF
ncbi:TraB family protein [archaeon]|nr:TraB family protein [archaeon]MBL7056694.1 TraB family protein [Candidatus Woesearchaeota archaeon]